MKDTESADLIYLLESKSVFIFSWEQLLYGNYFLSLFETDFYGDGGWVDEEFLAPGQGSKLINQHLFYWATILKRWLMLQLRLQRESVKIWMIWWRLWGLFHFHCEATVKLRACLNGGEVTFGGSLHLSCKREIIWTGGLPHLSRLPHLSGVPHLHENRP